MYTIQTHEDGQWGIPGGSAPGSEWTTESVAEARELAEHAVGLGYSRDAVRIVGDDGSPITGQPGSAWSDAGPAV